MSDDPRKPRRDATLLAGGVIAATAATSALALAHAGHFAFLTYPFVFNAFAMMAGRLRWRGALLLALTVCAAWYAAFFVGALIFARSPGGLCIFCSAEEVRNAARVNAPYLAAAGAAASFVACLITLGGLRLLGAALRTQRALRTWALVTLVLMLIGGVGMTGSLTSSNNGLLVVAPWQVVYGAGLALLLWPHRPIVKAKA